MGPIEEHMRVAIASTGLREMHLEASKGTHVVSIVALGSSKHTHRVMRQGSTMKSNVNLCGKAAT